MPNNRSIRDAGACFLELVIVNVSFIIVQNRIFENNVFLPYIFLSYGLGFGWTFESDLFCCG